jgi:hypothetical protein
MSGATRHKEFADDADLTHPWAARYRIPVIAEHHPRWSYEVALVVPDPAEDYSFRTRVPVWPTEDEAALIAVAIAHRMEYYRDSWAAKMRERPLDVDSTTNTLILRKTDKGWDYSRRSWTQPWSVETYPTLIQLLNHVLGCRSWYERLSREGQP